ncbi:MAG TPA: VRR-NUC domain-containing protein [Chloroflexota bacterium]|jgi:hypothetical protein
MASLAPVRERDFQAAVLQLARLRGWLCGFTWRSWHSPYGEPDLRCVRWQGPGTGRCLWIELKTARGQPTPEQYEWLWLGHLAGIETYLWTPDDWDEIQAVLR